MLEQNKDRLILFFAVTMVTSSSFIVRFGEQEPYVLAFVRVLLSGILSLLLAFSLGSSNDRKTMENLQNLEGKDYALILLSGLSLATHFGWWFDSLGYIPISTSLSLTNTAPVWLAILGYLIYRQKLTRNQVLAIITVIIGSVILFLEDTDLGSNSTTGLILALGSAIGFAFYLMIAKLRVNQVGLWLYFGLVNLSSAFFLFLWITFQQKLSLLLSEIWFWGILLAIFPGILGHALYNRSMGKLNQVDVGIATLGEPVLGTILAWIIFDEWLSTQQFLGIFALLSAIAITQFSKKSSEFQ